MADLVPYSQAATTSLVSTLQNSDLMALAREDNDSDTGYQSKVTRVDTIAKKVVKETDYSDLQTTSKNPIGAINEVNAKASQFDNMTATASGSIATFSDGGDDIPVSEFECEIVAQQASGTPTPDNPLAITGFSQADIAVCGKNLFDESQIINASGWSESGGVYTGVVAQLYLYANNGFPKQPKYKANTQYTLSVHLNATNAVSRFRIYYTDSTYSDLALASTMVGTTLTLTTLQNKTVDKIMFTYNAGGDLSISKIQLEEGTSASAYVAYTGNLYTVSFGQTIYGGRLIYANGQWSIKATYGYVDLGSLNWVGISRDRWNTTELMGSIKTPTTNSQVANIICSALASKSADNVYLQNEGISVQTTGDTTIYSPTLVGKTSAEVQTALAGVQFVYELATPTIIPITSSTRIKTISGDNNIYSNTGDCELKYFTNKADSLAELIKAFVL